MSSGVPKLGVWGLVLFSSFISNVELGLSSEVAKVVDDIKWFRVVKAKNNWLKSYSFWVNGLQNDCLFQIFY